jgi:hypothetical protein
MHHHLKKTVSKGWRGVAQVIECLPSKCKAEFKPQYCPPQQQQKKTKEKVKCK